MSNKNGKSAFLCNPRKPLYHEHRCSEHLFNLYFMIVRPEGVKKKITAGISGDPIVIGKITLCPLRKLFHFFFCTVLKKQPDCLLVICFLFTDFL